MQRKSPADKQASYKNTEGKSFEQTPGTIQKDKESSNTPLAKENKSGLSSIMNQTKKKSAEKNFSRSITPEYQQDADYINRIEKLTSEQKNMVDNYIINQQNPQLQPVGPESQEPGAMSQIRDGHFNTYYDLMVARAEADSQLRDNQLINAYTKPQSYFVNTFTKQEETLPGMPNTEQPKSRKRKRPKTKKPNQSSGMTET